MNSCLVVSSKSDVYDDGVDLFPSLSSAQSVNAQPGTRIPGTSPGLVWDMFLGVEERESEVIASKRERELRSMAGRESRPRERVCSVSQSLQKGVTVLNITEFDFQKFKSDS